MQEQNALVLASELTTANGKKIGHVTLNKPKALNALNLSMIRLLLPQMLAWQQDDEVVAVILDGSGDKAFCAGGDVVAMHNAMAEKPGQVPELLKAFFAEEYRLDYLLHTFNKPLLVWGNGIVMGGGLGLMSGASHRIVTESSRIAMPEISIGLYPDVGGSWFLNRMPQGCGLFLGLTGASINATDALYVKLADHFISHELKDDFVAQMLALKWGGTQTLNHEKLTSLCAQFQRDSQSKLPKGNIKEHQSLIADVTSHASLPQVVSAIQALEPMQDNWLARAVQTLNGGSAISAHLVWQQLARGRKLSLEDCFRMELNMSCRCGELGEFQEGVRALLIDKDNQPKWRYESVNDVPQALIEHFFSPLWSATEHPLVELGKE
ncbi:enoyl-CoA hydratase/isomerase family protein [Bowmanella denitrificans]|uniref:3-hydroxyisobutyryl-CoA hydrolase n=1 Tax=Bowmanella denitrificans TaxID=366582 RepID=A0ABP3GQK3_9ALTE